MSEPDIRKIVEEIVGVLHKRGYLAGPDSASSSKTDWRDGEGSLKPLENGARATVGTAGKVFSGDWRKTPAAPSRAVSPTASSPSGDEDHSGSDASCPHCDKVSSLSEKDLKELGLDRIAVCKPAKSRSPIARLVDHTLLKPNATQEEIAKLCEEAKTYCFASVCIPPSYVPLSARLLTGSGVKVCTVIGFPLGSTTSTVKAVEARDAIAGGAEEIDMVLNIGALKSGNDALVLSDIRAVREATRGRVLKVILETSLLSQDEKVRACLLSKKAGADFVKTSTGFGGGGATVEDIRLMRETVGPLMGVKASGGIRSADAAEAMVRAGATRLGTSASVAIVTGSEPASGKY
jgi:deoxyribose-phosphate aldolase